MNEKIKLLRKKLKLSQKVFGEKIGLSKSAISNMESGRYNITDTIVITICNIFSVNEQWLRTGEGDIFNRHSADLVSELCQELGLDELDERLVREYAKLKPEHRQIIKTLMKNVIGIEMEVELGQQHPKSIIKQTNALKSKKSSKANYERRLGPKYEYPASAGQGAFIGSNEYETVEIPEDAPLSANFGITINGHSMEPDIPHGSIVWVKPQNYADIGDICIVIIDQDGEERGYCKVKRNGYFESINPEYDDIIPTGKYRITGKVVYIQTSEEQ